MNRRSFLTGSVLSTAAVTFLGADKQVLALPPVAQGNPAISYLEVWWNILDKSGTEELPTTDTFSYADREKDYNRRWKIDQILYGRRDSVVCALKPLGFIVPRVGCDSCTHDPYPDMSQEDLNLHYHDPQNYRLDNLNVAMHNRFNQQRCSLDWVDDFWRQHGHDVKGDVRLKMVLRHPNMTIDPDEVLSLLGRQSLGIVDAKFETVQEVTKIAALKRAPENSQRMLHG